MTQTTAARPGPLPWSVGGDGTANKYGAYYWSIGLADGREVFVMADRVEVTSTGALVCWSDNRPGKEEVDREPRDVSIPTLGFNTGQWTCFYAASCLTGDPVAIDSLTEPAKAEGTSRAGQELRHADVD